MSNTTHCPYCYDGHVPYAAECCHLAEGTECCGDPNFVYNICEICEGTGEVERQVLMEAILRGAKPPQYPDQLFDDVIYEVTN